MRTVRACMLFAALAGCDRAEAPPSAAPAPAPATAAPPSSGVDCADRFEAVADRVGAIVVPDVTAPAGVTLPVAHGDTHLEPALATLAVRDDGTLELGGRPTSAADLARDLDAIRGSWPVLHPGTEAPSVLYLLAARDRTMGAVVDAVGAPVEGASLVLLARADRPRSLPCPAAAASLCDVPVGAGDDAQIPALFVRSCPDMRNVFVALAGSDRAARASLVAGALREMPSPTCTCESVDLALLEYASSRAAGALDAGYVAFPVTLPLDDEARARPVAAWVAAHAQ